MSKSERDICKILRGSFILPHPLYLRKNNFFELLYFHFICFKTHFYVLCQQHGDFDLMTSRKKIHAKRRRYYFFFSSLITIVISVTLSLVNTAVEWKKEKVKVTMNS